MRKRRFLVLILGAVFGLLVALIPAWSNARSVSPVTALELAQSGQQRYQVGQFNEAAQLWQRAADLYEQDGDRQGVTKSLINKSQALQELGLYGKSCDTLLQVFAVDTLDCNADQVERLLTNLSGSQFSLTEAIGLRSLGNVLRRQGFLQPSQAVLQLSLATVAETPEYSATLLSLANTERALGNQRRDRWDYEEITEIIDRQSVADALAPYEEALNLYQQTAEKSSSALTQVQAQLNQLSLLLETNQWWVEQVNRRLNSWSRLKQDKVTERAAVFATELQSLLTRNAQTLKRQIEANLANLPVSRAAVDARLNFAQCLMLLQERERAQLVLATAQEQAHSLKDSRAESYALGYLGKLDSQQEQLEQAIELTQQALLLAQEQNLSGDAREVTYLWQSQLGRLLREEQDIPGAISAYTAAFNTLQSLRADLNSNNRDVQFNFREEVKPVYIELADLLLQTDLTEDELDSLVVLDRPPLNRVEVETRQERLQLAQRVIESLQLAELDNFFQDPCVEETNVAVQIGDLDPQAAVFYPIVLPDRLEVLLSLPGKELQTVAIPVNESTVNQALDQLYDTLDNPTINDSARNILSTANPETGELEANLQKLLPTLTQMYDWLIRPWESQLQANSVKTLVFVLNGRLQKVPLAALYDGSHYLIENWAIALAPSLQLVSSTQTRQPVTVLAAGVSEPVQVRGESFPALTYVPEELNQIAAAFPRSQKMLNEEFTQTTLQSQLRSDFSVVHLATHAQFSSDPEKNFIVTGQDNSISIDQLSTLLKGRTQVPQLLVLSACQTATGDEQAVLGLAGVSVRSGVSSTLATLWPVEDASTTQLMGQFYQKLREPEGKKLEALRSAQLALMQSLNATAEVPHPYYWAPYVLVGNWQ